MPFDNLWIVLLLKIFGSPAKLDPCGDDEHNDKHAQETDDCERIDIIRFVGINFVVLSRIQSYLVWTIALRCNSIDILDFVSVLVC